MLKKITFVTIILLFSVVCYAQENKMTEEQQQAMMQQQFQAMTPMFGNMMTVMMNATFDVLARPESAEKLASFTKNYYDALVAKGFAKDEALRIVVAVGMPSMPSMQK